MNKESWQKQTRLIHASETENPSSAVSSPIYQTSTYEFEDPQGIADAMATDNAPQFYGRYASPNTRQVEATIAALEKGEAALATASGMAAISLALLTYLNAGDHLVAQTSLYPTTSNLITRKLPRLGIEHTLVDQADVSAFERAIRPNTRLLYIESPTNPLLRLTNLSEVAQLAQANDLITIADNTFATPYNQNPLIKGIDIVVHSATKYLAGHTDVVAGVIVAGKERVTQMWREHILLGALLHPQEAWLLERGMKTFYLRMARHNANALAVAHYLDNHPAVREVYYPGLPSHTQYDLAQQQMAPGYGGMVCFDLRGGSKAGYALLQRIELIKLAVSLGGLHSLMTHPASTISSVRTEEEITASGVRPGLVRFSVGLEDPEDIIADLDQALVF
ncbi:MAG: PLP-dependent aspartate aminotransferase family protein [Candidatus Promineifilaceae bacterium]|nr:PLP-dependent aspartate aminotransferase family protein [Candidatus Promineifilaceae bacterium]